VAVFQADRTVTAEVHVLRATTGLNIELLPRLSYEGLMRLMGSARAVVATTINDGLPSILVESMAFGALPIHSNLEPVREWIEDGRNGLLVPPEDAQLVANALCRVVRDDDLVDQAAGINEAAVRQNLNWEGVKSRALEIYSTAAGAGHS
jgi:glycosyltransferase involved in cell wall biosynthesis